MAIRDLLYEPDSPKNQEHTDTELDPELVRALQVLSRTDRLLVALDFDGTLAPLADHPSQSRSLPESHLAIINLNKLFNTRVALVSGRAIESLQMVAEPPPGVLLVGSHGLEFMLDEHDQPDLDLNTQEIRQVGAINEMLEGVTSDISEVWLEHKPAGVAMHTREATPTDGAAAQALALSSARTELDDSVSVKGGKNVLEFAVRQGNKGEALRRLREYTGATVVMFVGDDLTDEEGFAVLQPGDVGVHVGQHETQAEFRVTDPRQVAQMLTRLVAMRAGVLATAS